MKCVNESLITISMAGARVFLLQRKLNTVTENHGPLKSLVLRIPEGKKQKQKTEE